MIGVSMRKLNNKGYMLVEIILASVIAFGVAYFIIDLTIKLKNKNDDFFVETQVVTDRAIISNKLMDYLKEENDSFDCNSLNVQDQKILYKGTVIDTVNEYTAVGGIQCHNEVGQVNITVPLEVKQQQDRDYNVYINYKYSLGDSDAPTCKLTVSGNNISFQTKEDSEGGSGIAAYGLVKGTTMTYNSVSTLTIDGVSTYTGFVKDNAGNEGQCSISVKNSNSTTTYTCTKDPDDCSNGYLSNGWCIKSTSHSVKAYASNNLCTSACSGVCVAEECQYCPGGYDYASWGCVQYLGRPDICSGGCTQTFNTSCTGVWHQTNTSTNSDCADSGYVLTIDKTYCYKIN